MSNAIASSSSNEQPPAADIQSVIPVVWTKDDFEAPKNSILSFTNRLIAKNKQQGLILDREDIELEWTTNVHRIYRREDRPKSFFKAQVKSPAFEDFWCPNRLSGECTVFTRAELQPQDDPSRVVMEDSKGQLEVPNILLLPLHRLDFVVFVKELAIVNPDLEIKVKRARLLWSSVISVLYWYECSCLCKGKRRESKKLKVDEYTELVKITRIAAAEHTEAAMTARVTVESDIIAEGLDTDPGEDAIENYDELPTTPAAVTRSTALNSLASKRKEAPSSEVESSSTVLRRRKRRQRTNTVLSEESTVETVAPVQSDGDPVPTTSGTNIPSPKSGESSSAAFLRDFINEVGGGHIPCKARPGMEKMVADMNEKAALWRAQTGFTMNPTAAGNGAALVEASKVGDGSKVTTQQATSKSVSVDGAKKVLMPRFYGDVSMLEETDEEDEGDTLF